ncbi:MAG: type II secretion system protein [Phycisphaerales bacterium]
MKGVRMARVTTRRPAARGFTLIELLFGIGVIFLIMGLLLVGLRHAVRGARTSADSVTLNSLKTAMEVFRSEFGFVPPLVKDLPDTVSPQAPLTTGTPRVPVVYSIANPIDAASLRGDALTPAVPDLRFSLYTPAYYLMGALEALIDGKDGAGFTTPTREGAFTRKGRQFEPFFDTSRNAKALFVVDAPGGLVELRDQNNIAFRCYRWLPDLGAPNPSNPINDYLNVPAMVGDPEESAEVRSAEYALVSAGRDGLFGDEHLLPAGHPQQLSQPDVLLRLGLTDPTKIAAKAGVDNVVVVGAAK